MRNDLVTPDKEKITAIDDEEAPKDPPNNKFVAPISVKPSYLKNLSIHRS